MGSGEGERGNSPEQKEKLEIYEEPLSGHLEH